MVFKVTSVLDVSAPVVKLNAPSPVPVTVLFVAPSNNAIDHGFENVLATVIV